MLGCSQVAIDQKQEAQDPIADQEKSLTAPIAKISAVEKVSERSQAVLSADESSDDGQIQSYRWEIVDESGLPVRIAGGDSKQAQLIVGELLLDAEVQIRLTVVDDSGEKDSAEARVILNEVDLDLLPPQPGQAGRQTLFGVDSNSNGVRDDVEIAIHERYPQDYAKRQSLRLGAIALQDAIRSSTSSDDLDEDAAAQKLAAMVACLDLAGIENRRVEIAFLKAQMGNTADRIQSLGDFYAARSGTVTPVAEVTAADCGVE